MNDLLKLITLSVSTKKLITLRLINIILNDIREEKTKVFPIFFFLFPNQHYEIVFDFHELSFFYNKNINLCKMVGINLISYSISSDKILLRVVK